MGSAQASPPAAPESATPVEALDCRLGLVLSGGGARGFAHIGVLRELERHRVRIDCIAGTSVGAVIGALYASGHSSQAIETILRSMSFDSVYSDPHDRQLYPLAHRLRQRRVLLTLGLEASRVRFPKAILSDYLINRKLIQSLTAANFEAGREFSRLPIPFRAVSTDLRTGDRIILERGDLGRSVRGSMSVPLAYSPVELGETLLVDGGIVDNIPVDVARLMGAEFIIAVDVTTPVERGVSADVLGVSKQIIDLLYAVKNRSFEAEPDLLIKPDLERHGFSDYSDLDALIRLGADEAAALHALLETFPTLAALASATVEDVLTEWSGLGYYRRARALHALARKVVTEHGGRLPTVDGNVSRVLCRLLSISEDPRRAAVRRALEAACEPLLLTGTRRSIGCGGEHGPIAHRDTTKAIGKREP